MEEIIMNEKDVVFSVCPVCKFLGEPTDILDFSHVTDGHGINSPMIKGYFCSKCGVKFQHKKGWKV